MMPQTHAASGQARRAAARLTPGRLFLGSLGVILVGYAFCDRGFAYVGIGPLYVGEIVLGLGLLAALLGVGILRPFRAPTAWFLVLFMGLGLARTLPFVGQYGVDAPRDAVLWGYGLFALLVPACLLRSGLTDRVPGLYARLIPYFLVWAPIALLFYNSYQDYIPIWPGAPVGMIIPKTGDMAVHLAGVATFMLLGLHHAVVGGERRQNVAAEWGLWLCWFAGALMTSISRGGMLSIMGALVICMLVRPVASRLLQVGLIAALIAVILIAGGADFTIGASRRISAEQIGERFTSIYSDKADKSLGGSKEWRLQWWNTIIGYTIDGPYFWTGKGFGINLAKSDGFEVEWDNRDPHDAHLNVLARMGIPGLALWLLLQASFLLRMIQGYIAAVRARQTWWAKVNLWIFCYWIAFLINATFDVYLEGPQGGIWFWSVMGFGLAATEAQRYQARRSVPSFAVGGPQSPT
jgi:O-antigen ligase/polysaccharide polymerase Wzy-like membrane protein